MPPEITWVTPKEADPVSGTLTIEVRATDRTQVARLEVSVDGVPLVDTDTADPNVFRATFDTTSRPDGTLTLVATASDPAMNRASLPVTVTIVNRGAGIIAGVCVKGPLRGATVSAYRYEGGVRGAQIGVAARTDDNGRFSLGGMEGYSGPILLTCGGVGTTYLEEAAEYVAPIALSGPEELRAVLPAFTSKTATAYVTPWSTLTTAYIEWLVKGGQPLATAHSTASTAMSNLIGVVDLAKTAPVPLGPSVTTYTDESWIALTLAGCPSSAWCTRSSATRPSARARTR
jgi:hypothetical protein